MAFILGPKPKKSGCVFCATSKAKPGEASLVVHRGKLADVVLNKYPYANAHLLVITHRHVSDFTKLKLVEHLELSELLSLSIEVLKAELKPQGFNIGMNLGEIAGAGVKDHLHYHIVPRWQGDHNFMPVLGDVKVMPEHLSATYSKLRRGFANLANNKPNS